MWWAPPVLDASTCDDVAAGRAHLLAMGYGAATIGRQAPPISPFDFPFVDAVDATGRVLARAQLAYDCRLLTVEVREPAAPATEPTLEGALIRAAEALRPWVGGQDDTLVALPRRRGADVWLVRSYGGAPEDPLQTVARARVRPDGSVGRAVEDRGFWTVPQGPAAARSTWSLFGDHP